MFQHLKGYVTGSPTPSRDGALQDEARLGEVASPAPQPEVQRLREELRLAHEKLRIKEIQLSQQREDFERDNRILASEYDDLQRKHSRLLQDFYQERIDRTKDRDDCTKKVKDEATAEYNRALNQFNALLNELAEKNQDIMAQATTATEKALDAQKHQREAEKYCAKLEQENQSLTAAVREMQAGALRSVESTRWAPLPHSDVEHQVKSLLADIRQWCGSYAAFSYPQLMEPEAGIFEDFASSLIRHGCITSSEQLCLALSTSKPLQKGNKAMMQLLAAAASGAIFHKFFATPFHPRKSELTKGNVVVHRLDGAAVTNVYRYLKSSDENAAEAWRCQLLRLLDTTHLATLGRKVAGEDLVIEFVAALNPVGQGLQEEMQASLLPIVKEVVELSRQLWTRKARIVVMGFVTLGKHLGQAPQIVFKSTSEYLEAHALHKPMLDDDDQALDGKEVIMVCSPAVVAFGNAKGEDYATCHVIKKAVVWMG